MALGAGRGVPPGLEEGLPLLLGDRADHGPPALTRVAMDAGEQPARAPLLPATGLEATTDRESPAPKGLEGDHHRGPRQPGGGAEIVRADGTGDLEVALDEGHRRLVGVHRLEHSGQAGRQRLIGDETSAREQRF